MEKNLPWNGGVADPIQSTAGAVPVVNEKGELSMQKVKVHRYICGKRPEYAPVSSSEDESDEEGFLEQNRQMSPQRKNNYEMPLESILKTDDPRLRRLISSRVDQVDDNDEDIDTDRRRNRLRHAPTAEVLSGSEDEGTEAEEPNEMPVGASSSEEEDEADLSDDEIERRRMLVKQRALMRKQDRPVEILDKEDDAVDKEESSSESSEEEEEYTDSEEETGPRLKPVFVRKKDRVTILEKEKEAAKKKQLENEMKKKAEERRRQTLKMVEEEIRKEVAGKKVQGEEGSINDVNTDDENDEVEYEAWKLRELKRIKRDREEREQREKELVDIERVRNMTEEERRQDLRMNPRVIVNQNVKGKYKFMQKYYHRGAFYMNEESHLLKRNFSAATLDDHFDKTVLPKVMQVKNFGRSGRTKYTHLVDQDTTQFESPWQSDTANSLKFNSNHAAAMKQVFSRPSLKKNKTK